MKRLRLWLALMLFVIAGSFLLPAVHWRVAGWAKGEAFYEERPTSYWSYEVRQFSDEFAKGLQTINVRPSAPQSVMDRIRGYLGLTLQRPAILRADPAAAPVLIELTKDQHPVVRFQAERYLKQIDLDAAAKASLNDP